MSEKSKNQAEALDEKALDAARRGYEQGIGVSHVDCLRGAIRAYIASLPEESVVPVGEWEFFCDHSFFDMWCVRRKDAPKLFGDGYHVASEAEAKSLTDVLNRTPAIDDAELLEATEVEVKRLLQSSPPIKAAAVDGALRIPNLNTSVSAETQKQLDAVDEALRHGAMLAKGIPVAALASQSAVEGEVLRETTKSESELLHLTEYEIQVLLGCSIHGCNMSPDRVFSLPMAWHRLHAIDLIDRTDGLAIITEKERKVIDTLLATLGKKPVATGVSTGVNTGAPPESD